MSAMRLWLTKASDIPIRDQLETQLALAILSGDIAPGERLPSTRELARRYKIHANTVSAAFRALEQKQWVQFKKGSGIYARQAAPTEIPADLIADHLIAELVRAAKAHSLDLRSLRSRLNAWVDHHHVRGIVVVDKDEQLRRILAAEIGAAIELPVSHSADARRFRGERPALVVGLSTQAQETPNFLRIQLASAERSLAQWLPAPKDKLVAVLSSHSRFLEVAHTFLRAAGFPAESLVVRNVNEAGWKSGLDQVDAVVCDTLTARRLPKVRRVIPFRLLSSQCLEEIRKSAGL
jgi:DNA-binding transcriptional regulator YhcF (GntR family)